MEYIYDVDEDQDEDGREGWNGWMDNILLFKIVT